MKIEQTFSNDLVFIRRKKLKCWWCRPFRVMKNMGRELKIILVMIALFTIHFIFVYLIPISADIMAATVIPPMPTLQTPPLLRELSVNERTKKEDDNSSGDIDYPLEEEIIPKKEGEFKKILLWNDFFGVDDFGLGVGKKYFKDKRCSFRNCITIVANNITYPMEEMDAVVFHPRSTKKHLPSVRSPHTRYVFLLLECPYYSHNNISMYNNLFNYTMTYRQDSDIYLSNGRYRRLNSLDKTRWVRDPIELARKKNKMVAWVVSDCDTYSKREKIAKKLQSYTQVDIYGRCGRKMCPFFPKNACFELLERRYKFYLAFENSLCQDYVTEKLYQYSRYYIIPIVYGGADYKKIAPPHSFIDVKDYRNVQHLVEYLHYLDKNDTAYVEYFAWKKKYKAVNVNDLAWCDLCAKLHQDTKPKVYRNLTAWYEKDKCQDPTEFLREFLSD